MNAHLADRKLRAASEQDISLWSRTMIEEAERCLSNAAQAGRIGRFQLEAAIQSVHIFLVNDAD